MLNPNQILKGGFGLVRGVTRQAERLGRHALSTALGTAQTARPAGPEPKDLDDATLARKVESELFRDAHPLKGHIDVNAVDGTVYLRGEVKRPDQISELEARARAIPEVTGVENLLHLPKTPARSRSAGSGRGRSTRSAKASASAETPQRRSKAKPPSKRSTARRTPGKVSDDKTTRLVEKAEQTGEQARAAKRGRQPAPLGSAGNGGEPQRPGRAVAETGSAPAARTKPSADTPPRRSKAKPPSKRSTARRTPGKVSDDKTTRLVEKAEQTGEQASAAGRGRRPAPLGSKGDAGESPPSPVETATGTEPAPTPPSTSAPVTAPARAPSTPRTGETPTGGTGAP
jgi:BON domain-containing protein